MASVVSNSTPISYDGYALLAGYTGIALAMILSMIGAGIGSHKSFWKMGRSAL